MAVMSRLLPLVAFSTFAIFVLALLATPANALSNNHNVHVGRGHDSVAKRKRTAMKRAKRCRPQPASLTSSSAAPEASAPPDATPEVVNPEAANPDVANSKSKSSTTSSSAAPVSTPATSGTNGKKLLLGWPNGPTNLEKFVGNNVVALYDWSPYPIETAAGLGIPFLPMLWGYKQVSAFNSLLNTNTQNCGIILGPNEPNQDGQSDMSPQDGANLWKTVIQPLRNQGCKLASPATTSAPSGKIWMQDMMKACGDAQCDFDFITMHWYGTSSSEFQDYVTDFYNTFKKPLIISEYACQNFAGGAQCTKEETLTFHYTMAAWFDQTDMVAMYAPFGFMLDMGNVNPDNQLMASDGGPNELGKWYLNH